MAAKHVMQILTFTATFGADHRYLLVTEHHHRRRLHASRAKPVLAGYLAFPPSFIGVNLFVKPRINIYLLIHAINNIASFKLDSGKALSDKK